MKTFVDGNGVFVAADDFVDLQESDAVFGSTHDFCVAAAVAMAVVGASKTVNFVDSEYWNSTWPFAFKEGRILKVTIEWVDAHEADPDNHKEQ